MIQLKKPSNRAMHSVRVGPTRLTPTEMSGIPYVNGAEPNLIPGVVPQKIEYMIKLYVLRH